MDLVGFTGSGLAHLNWKAFGESVPQRLDRLVDEGRMGPVVAAFPDCFTSLGGNQYIDSAAMGRWEAFLIDEMLPRLEAGVPPPPRPGAPGRLRQVLGRLRGHRPRPAPGRGLGGGGLPLRRHGLRPVLPRPTSRQPPRFLAAKGGVAGFLEAFAAAPKTDR